MSGSPDFHENYARHEDVRGSSNRGFGIVFAGVFALIGLLPVPYDGAVRWWAVALAGAILGAAFLAPRILSPFNHLWMRFGLLLHRTVNPLVMALLFFSTVTPIGLLMRALGKDPLRLKWDRAAASYWIVRTPPGPAPDTMKNQF